MPDARDLGFLLHKHPDRAQSFDVASGAVHVVWPQATPEESTVALVLEVDPIALVRGKGRRSADGLALAQYVNDRPYAASSMLAVALGKVFRTALARRCDARPGLAEQPIPLRVHVPALPSRGDSELVGRLFAPLGWDVEAVPIALDPEITSWGDAPYADVRLSGTMTLADALSQLYVLIPALDDTKHYWIGTDEVDKLLRAGETWLVDHPERELITRRYLGHHGELVVDALARLAEIDELEPPPGAPAEDDSVTSTPVAQLRREAVVAALRAERVASVVDLGCGEGGLLRELVRDPTFVRVVGTDVSHRALGVAERRLRLDTMPDSQRARLELLQSSLVYRDDRLAGFDAAVLMEVIEHVDQARLPAVEGTVFGHARPTLVLVTTPNAEYNVRYPELSAGAMRHHDHRFEWTREEFRGWAGAVGSAYGYAVRFVPIGVDDPEVGPPTQMAVFRRRR